MDVGGFLIYRKGNRICTDRKKVFAAVNGGYYAQSARLISETPEIKGEAHLEVLVDENMVEAFVNDGEYVITNAVYHLGRYVTSNVSKDIQLYTAEEE